MDIGNAKIAFGISFKMIDDMLKAFHHKNVFPQKLDFDHEIEIMQNITATVHIMVDIHQPHYNMHLPDDGLNPYGLLHLSGDARFQITFAGETSPELFTIPFSTGVRLTPDLRHKDGVAPFVRLHYEGVDYVSEPFATSFVSNIMNSSEIQGVLDEFKLDVVEPIIDALETVYYFNDPPDQKPGPDDYNVQLKLMQKHSGHTEAIGLFVNLPGSLLDNIPAQSIVPKKSEVMMHIPPGMIQIMVDRGKNKLQDWIEDFSDTIKVTELSLSLDDNRIVVNGKVKETTTDSKGSIKGSLYIRHMPGKSKIILDGTEIDLDIDLPWWLDALAFLIPPLGFMIDAAVNIAEQQVPDLAQKTAQNLINGTLGKITLENLSVEGVPFEIYPDTIELEDNAITLNIQVLFWPLTENLARADYAPIFERFVMFHLETGRRYMTSDLARLMEKGMVNIPGYHQVGGKYIRSNPDTTSANNLLERFEWG